MLARVVGVDCRRSVARRSTNRRREERPDPLPDSITTKGFDRRVEQLARHAPVVSREKRQHVMVRRRPVAAVLIGPHCRLRVGVGGAGCVEPLRRQRNLSHLSIIKDLCCMALEVCEDPRALRVGGEAAGCSRSISLQGPRNY